MIGGLPGNSFVFVEFQEGSGVFEVATLALGAVGLDLADGVQGFLELAGEPRVVQAEGGEGAVGVDDVEVGAVEESGFEQRDAVEAPGGVGELLGELSFGGSGGLILVEELAAVLLVGGGVLSGEDGGTGGCWLLVAGCWLLVTDRGLSYLGTSGPVLAWADGVFVRGVADVVGQEGKMVVGC
jgi:hypothetical protein